MILSKLILIAFIIVFIIDYSGFIDEMDKILTKALRSKVPLHIPKPFSCGFCSTFWAGLIYLICVHQFTFLNIAAVCVVTAFTPEILAFMHFMKDLFNHIMDSISKFLNLI